MDFAKQPPSQQWAALKYRGERFAEVWFKPEGDPCALTFRIPNETFQNPGMGEKLTPENLLRAVGIAPAEVESWRHGDVCHAGMDGCNPELRNPCPPPPQDLAQLDIYVRLQNPAEAIVTAETGELEVFSTKWQDLEARWRAILSLEATIDTLRMNMEGLRAEMESSSKKMLSTEEKLHALRADVAQWTKSKNRAHHALPKVRDFIHRSLWATGSPERKQLAELYKNHIQPRIHFPQMDKLLEQLENLQKDRQVLSALGVTVHQECKRICVDTQGAFKTLQSNAVANAYKKNRASRAKGKFF